MQIYHSLTVDVAKRNKYKAVSAKQLDCNSRFLKIKLQNNGSAFDIPENATVALAVERNGETKAFNCTYEDGCIVAPLDTWVLQESGYVDCEIILLDTEMNSKLSSFLFSLEIEENIYNDEDIKSDENYDLLLSLVGDVKSSQIVSITEKVNGLKHTYTVLFGNGESKEFVISDGAKGDKGDKGDTGATGKDGVNGADGKDGAPGTTVYSELTDKPSINNVTLEGNKTLDELGIDIPTKLTDLENDGTFIENDNYASYSRAGIVQLSVGGGLVVDKNGILRATPPVKDITSKTDDIRVTHGSGTYTLEFNSGRYAKSADLAQKQDSLTAEQLANIKDVPNKQDALTAEQLNNIAAVPSKQDKLIAGTTMELIRDYTLAEDRAVIGLRTYADGYLGVKDIAVEIKVKGNSSGVSGKGINMHINGSSYWVAMLKSAFEKDENNTNYWHYLLTGFMTADGYFIPTNALGNGDKTAFGYTLQYAHSFNTIFDPGAIFNPATTPYISQIRLSTDDNALGIGAGTQFKVWGTKYYG